MFMINRVKSITEKTVTTLPDGFYIGTWGGYTIEVQYKEKTFELETENGVKGIGIKVVVQVKNGEATFEEINC